jgi:S1-C subfamily serine protease
MFIYTRMKFVIIRLIVISSILLPFCVFSQHVKPYYQSNTLLEFDSFLSGVKNAYLVPNNMDVKTTISNPLYIKAILGGLNYLKKIGFENVEWGGLDHSPRVSSLCDVAIVSIAWKIKDDVFTDITLSFISCNNDTFTFLSKYNAWIGLDMTSAFYDRCFEMYPHSKNYLKDQRLKLTSDLTYWSEEKLLKFLDNKGTDKNEGVYECMSESQENEKYKLGVVKTDTGYVVIYFSGANNYEDWKEGEIKAKLSATGIADLYKVSWKRSNKTEDYNVYCTFDKGTMSISSNAKERIVYLKLYPTVNDKVISNGKIPKLGSGSGFGLTTNGIIVTNYHVIEGAEKISVRGINSNFTKAYKAKVLVSDKNNDLALIQIDDADFSNLGTISYTIKKGLVAVGESIFVLGYPLRATMGDEIKLTNGIVSSKSGFQGDVTSYQISAPIQPGNSGGPLFDSQGNLVGIINAKHSGAENASYAVKSNYLTSLIELLPNLPKLQTLNLLTGKSLTQQVELAKKFVYIIETE